MQILVLVYCTCSFMLNVNTALKLFFLFNYAQLFFYTYVAFFSTISCWTLAPKSFSTKHHMLTLRLIHCRTHSSAVSAKCVRSTSWQIYMMLSFNAVDFKFMNILMNLKTIYRVHSDCLWSLEDICTRFYLRILH